MRYSEFELGQEEQVSELVWTVFTEYEAPIYPEKGINTFREFIAADNLKNMVCNSDYKIYCCHENEKLLGVMAIRGAAHISLLFVHEDYHKRGIAKNLISYGQGEISKADKEIKQITVNASPYAKDIYLKMGFTAIGEIQERDGLIFIPMVKIL